MPTISLCMIVKNEEKVLARCLDSVREIADEIIILDTGSTDDTMKIAGQYTDHVYPFAWVDDFSAARNASFARATMDYILWLDADDVIEDADRARFLELKKTLPSHVDVAMLQYKVAFDRDGNCTFHYFRERLVRRAGGYLWQEPVHEHLVIHGKVEQYEIAVTHRPGPRPMASTRNLDIYRGQEEKGAPLSTRALYYYARELKTHGFFQEAVDRYRRFLAAGDGWVEDRITCAGDLSQCLLELGRRQDALEALVASFAADLPRAEICCKLGKLYMQSGEDAKATFWYGLALTVPRPGGWGFLSEDDWGFVPHMQLCVLCDRAGKREEARIHHLAAMAIKPTDPCVLYNKEYFDRQGVAEES